MQETIFRKVDNRSLVLSLDGKYRSEMMWFEEKKLLPAAKKLTDILNIKPPEVPIEGYYDSSPKLTEYFTIMRALQNLSDEDSRKVNDSDEYQLLFSVTGSPIYGQKNDSGGFFPLMKDPLNLALENTPVENWNAETLVDRAYQFTKETEDCSLVGLGALCRDAILITAFKESTVLYWLEMFGAAQCIEPPRYVYEWNVDKEIEERANRFISHFNELTASDIPAANSENAEYFYIDPEDAADIRGRCARIGVDDRIFPIHVYL